MNSVLAIAEKMLIDHLVSNKTPLTGESKIKGFLIAFSFVMALISVGFLSYAAFLWLSAHYPPMIVMASMGGIALALSLLGSIIAYAMIEYKYIKMMKMKAEFIKVAEDAYDILEQELSAPVNDNPKSAVLISAMAGYLAGNRLL